MNPSLGVVLVLSSVLVACASSDGKNGGETYTGWHCDGSEQSDNWHCEQQLMRNGRPVSQTEKVAMPEVIASKTTVDIKEPQPKPAEPVLPPQQEPRKNWREQLPGMSEEPVIGSGAGSGTRATKLPGGSSEIREPRQPEPVY